MKVAVCAIAKNENLYIREWVEWYKNLGVSKIFLYDNNDLDGEHFEEVIDDYIDSDFVEVIDVRGVEKGCVYDEEGINLQPKCYIDCYENIGKQYDWICFFDIDEFLVFKNGYNLFTFLNQDIFNDTDTILIPWEHYDDNNLIYYDSRPVMERFTHKSKRLYHGVKSIVRTNKIINDKKQGCLIHIFRCIQNKIKYSTGLKINTFKTWYQFNEIEFNQSNCKLNHYKSKSTEEYLKRYLGRHWGTGKKYTDKALNISDCKNEYFLYNEKNNDKLEFFDNYLLLDTNIIYDYEIYKDKLIEFGNKKNIILNLDKPKTINDKINWIKIHPNKLKIKCTDKILVHDYSKQILGKDICIPILKVYNNINEIIFNDLPNQYVIKCNHGCGYNIIVKDNNNLNQEKTIKKLNNWLNTNFAFKAGYEMQYDKIIPRIYVEKYMGDIADYKFWCFNGKPLYWVYSLGNNGGLTEHLNFYDMNNNLTNLNNAIHPRNPNIVPIIPDNFNEMIEISKKLSQVFDFVRVDLYSIDNKIYLGELTFTPSGGWMRFGKDSIMLGNLLNLST